MDHKAVAKFQRKVRRDPQYRAQVLQDVRRAARDLGVVEVPGLELRLVENTADLFHVVFPPRLHDGDPNHREISSFEEEQVVGGVAIVGDVTQPRLDPEAYQSFLAAASNIYSYPIHEG